jgi:hypothetical protein
MANVWCTIYTVVLGLQGVCFCYYVVGQNLVNECSVVPANIQCTILPSGLWLHVEHSLVLPRMLGHNPKAQKSLFQ